MSSWQQRTRKALQAVLQPVAAAQSPAVFVQWPNTAKPTDVEEYFRFTMHYSRSIVREIGPAPRIEGRGFAKIGVLTRIGTSEDRNDTLAGIVAAAYPYNSEFVFDGQRVTVDTVDKGDAVPDETTGWLYAPVDVNWTVWRIP